MQFCHLGTHKATAANISTGKRDDAGVVHLAGFALDILAIDAAFITEMPGGDERCVAGANVKGVVVAKGELRVISVAHAFTP